MYIRTLHGRLVNLDKTYLIQICEEGTGKHPLEDVDPALPCIVQAFMQIVEHGDTKHFFLFKGDYSECQAFVDRLEEALSMKNALTGNIA